MHQAYLPVLKFTRAQPGLSPSARQVSRSPTLGRSRLILNSTASTSVFGGVSAAGLHHLAVLDLGSGGDRRQRPGEERAIADLPDDVRKEAVRQLVAAALTAGFSAQDQAAFLHGDDVSGEGRSLLRTLRMQAASMPALAAEAEQQQHLKACASYCRKNKKKR